MRTLVVLLLLVAPALHTQEPLAAFDSAWSAVSRTYWDTALVNGRWLAVRDSLRAAAVDADRDGVRAAIRALIAVPGQSHFALIPADVAPANVAPAETAPAGVAPPHEPRGPGTTGLDVRMVADTLVVSRVNADSPAARAGVSAGTIITHVDRISVDSVLSALVGDTTAGVTREDARRLTNAIMISRLAGDAGDTARVRLAGGRTLAITRAELAGRATRFGSLPPMVVRSNTRTLTLRGGATVPVIVFSAWFPVIAAELDRQLFAARAPAAAAGVIIDLRGNPGGLIGMLAGVSGHFLDSAVSLGTMYARGATIHFPANPRLVDRAGERVDVIRAPLAILVDEFTGSTSEFFASGMQAVGRARIFGVTSAGQALPSMAVRLPGGDVLMHAIADHEDADGRRVEGVGVHPDEATPLSRADLLAGTDAALEAARAWIEGLSHDTIP